MSKAIYEKMPKREKQIFLQNHWPQVSHLTPLVLDNIQIESQILQYLILNQNYIPK